MLPWEAKSMIQAGPSSNRSRTQTRLSWQLHTARFEASTFRKSRALCVTALSYSIQETFERGESASKLDSPTSQQDAHETKCARGNGRGSTTLASRDAPCNPPPFLSRQF